MRSPPEQTQDSPAQRASRLMKEGIAIMETASRQGLEYAISCFDRALEIRLGLSFADDSSWSGYVLAASWMNRAYALTKLGGSENLSEAIRSYDGALKVLRGIPLDENPLYRRRFAIAWLNRGLSLLTQGTDLTAALNSIDQGIEVVGGLSGEEVLAASGWMNRANVLGRLGTARTGDARESAERAIALVRQWECDDVVAAEIGLKARHILCQSLAALFGVQPERDAELISAAVDSVHSGLEIGRAWEQKGEAGFREITCQLFRFGALAIQHHRPAALLGFLENSLASTLGGPDDQPLELHRAAREALVLEWQRLQREGFAAINTPRLDQWIQILRALREIEEKLRIRM